MGYFLPNNPWAAEAVWGRVNTRLSTWTVAEGGEGYTWYFITPFSLLLYAFDIFSVKKRATI